MATEVDAICRACGHGWQGELLGGTRMAGKYRCDKCGAARGVTFDDLLEAGLDKVASVWDLNRRQTRKVLGRCTCGGQFDHRSPVRCPHCGSDDLELTGTGTVVC